MKEGRRDSTPLLRGDRRKATRNNQEHGVTDPLLSPSMWIEGEAGTYSWQSRATESSSLGCWEGVWRVDETRSKRKYEMKL